MATIGVDCHLRGRVHVWRPSNRGGERCTDCDMQRPGTAPNPTPPAEWAADDVAEIEAHAQGFTDIVDALDEAILQHRKAVAHMEAARRDARDRAKRLRKLAAERGGR